MSGNKRNTLQFHQSSIHYLHLYIQTTEKSGYLKKMDLKFRNWNRRWFVLKGTELKYYKPNRIALKGVINLDSWCKLAKGQSPEIFQLVTPRKTYHLVCKSEQECQEWVQGGCGRGVGWVWQGCGKGAIRWVWHL